MRRSSSPSASRCWRRFSPDASISASAARPKPHAILAVAAVAADTDAEAERLAATIDLNFVRRARGEYLPLASPQEAAAYDYAPIDRERIRRNRSRVFVGTTETILA